MIIWRYLSKEVYGSLLITTTLVMLVLISNQFINYLNRAAAGNIPVTAVMQIMSLQIPLLLGLLLPLGLFLGILLAYGRFYSDYEMTVLFSSGVSKARLLGMTLLFASVISLIVAVLMLVVEPKMVAIKNQVLAQTVSSSPIASIYPDQFTYFENGRIVLYADKHSPKQGQIEQVFVAENAGGDKWNIVKAERGFQQKSASGVPYFVLADGIRYVGAAGKLNYRVVQFAHYGMQLPSALSPSQSPQTLSLWGLWQRRHQGAAIQAELQWRLALPISVILLAMIALALSQIKPRRGRYTQLIPAILIYVVYADFIFLSQAWLKKGKLPLWLGMWWVHGLMLLLVLFLLRWRYFEKPFWPWRKR